MDILLRWIELLAPCIATAALGWIVSARKSRLKQTEELKKEIESLSRANDMGTMALMRMRLVDAFEEYVIRKRPMSIERKQEIENLWEAYHDGMGGDGTAEPLYEALHEVKPHIVGSDSYDS